MRQLFWVSMGLNLLLAGYLWTTHYRETPSPSSHSDAPSQSGSMTAVPETINTPKLAPEKPEFDSLQWSRIQDDDLHRFVDNLRSVHCPEPVIQAVVIEELDREFTKRWKARPLQTNFWSNGSDNYIHRERERQLKLELETERAALIQELLGVGPHELLLRQWEDRQWFQSVFMGALSPEKGVALNNLLRKYTDLRRTSSAFSGDIMTLKEEEQRLENYNQMLTEMNELLTPEELEEIELRLQTVEVLDVWSLASQFGNEFTPMELREFLRIKKTEEPWARAFLGRASGPSKSMPLAEQERKIKNLLGTERYNWYVRAKQPGFRRFQREVNALNLGIEMTWKVCEIHDIALAECNRVRQNQDLTGEQQQAVLQSIRRETESRLTTTLGATAWEKYRGAGWIKELSNQ